MKLRYILVLVIAAVLWSCKSAISDTRSSRMNIDKDLLLANFDCKTDVDDLHSVAAFITLLSHPSFSHVNYHAVAGAYGIQEGLYVPPNSLFQLAFTDNWTDAHENFEIAVNKVKNIVQQTLAAGGDIWIAEAGQSDFSAALIKAVQIDLPTIVISQRFHLVQHSDWNEESTSPESLQFVKEMTDYQKIADGNVMDNGSPGFRSPEYKDWKTKVTRPQLVEIWKLATDLGNQYNGKEGRYTNSAITDGGLDFSDLSETCWILGIEDTKDITEFFDLYSD